MKIKIGATRIAVIFQNITFKIARIRFFKSAIWYLKYKLGYTKLARRQSKRSSLRNYLGLTFSGIRVNLLEYYYSRNYANDKKIFETYWTLFGLINIQKTGSEIIDNKKLLEHQNNIGNRELLKKLDLLRSNQFGLDKDNKIRIVDYGGRYVIGWLSYNYKKHPSR